MYVKNSLLLCLVIFIFACQTEETADVVMLNGNFYTVNAEQPRAEAVAVKDGRIMKIGTTVEIEKLKGDDTELIDLKGQFAMPGLIEGHGHFSGLGQSMLNLNFLRSASWDEIVEMVAKAAENAKPGEWITGRGWHQEKWLEPLDRDVLGYPYHDKLSAVSPNNPVLLGHASGHGLFANAKAMELAGVSKETPNPSGGEIVRDSRGEAIGVFEERAQAIIRAAYQEYINTLTDDQKKDTWLAGIEAAQQECLENGITSFQDAGSSYQDIDWYKELAESGDLDMRLWVMLRHSHDRMKDNMVGFPIINAGDHFFTCKAIKTEVDGALGSFGAWLLSSYDDKTDFIGQNTTPISEVEKIAALAIENDMQLCVHAIGDKANQVVLDIMQKNLEKRPDNKDQRWRIEHAQHLDPADIPRFSELGVIASMQGIHCTSDAPFVVRRLGEERARDGAYPWRSLLDSGARVANGTDAPVEDVDPFECLYASVTRKRVDSGLEFFPEQRMTREEALYSYTLWNAYAAFEENDKGSLEVGKLADIVVLSKDLATCTDTEILETEVKMTIVGGEVKFMVD